jgi:transcriptional regulator with XRE-family HTH domain
VTDVAGALRAARERAGLSLAEISARTKIKVAFLEAIERSDFERLPGTFFTRTFLRTYAREVRVSPDEVVAAYDAMLAPVIPETVAPKAAAPAPTTTFRPHVQQRSFMLSSPRSVWPTIALGVAIIAVVSLITRPKSDAPTEAQPVGTFGVAASTPSPSSVPQPSPPQKLTIDIRPSRTLWVAGMADGKRVIYRLVEPGEHVRIDAHEDLWFRVGDAGAFVYSINGSPDKPLGSPGEVRELRITRDNYRQLGS